MGLNRSNTTISSSELLHPKFGKIFTSEIQDKIVLTYLVGFQNINQIEDWKILSKNLNKYHQILLIPLSYRVEQPNFCGMGGNVQLKYDNYPYSLRAEWVNRRSIHRPFTEPQLWYLLYSIVQGAYTVNRYDQILGDIRSENIVLNEDGLIRLICQASYPMQYSSYQLSFDSEEIILLAPELAEIRSRNKKYTPIHHINMSIAEIFTIALTIVQVALLRCCSQLYTERYLIRFNLLHEFIDLVQERYSKYIATILRQMLESDPTVRIKTEELMEILRPYNSSIMKLIPFVPNYRNRIFNQKGSNNGRKRQTKKKIDKLDIVSKSMHVGYVDHKKCDFKQKRIKKNDLKQYGLIKQHVNQDKYKKQKNQYYSTIINVPQQLQNNHNQSLKKLKLNRQYNFVNSSYQAKISQRISEQFEKEQILNLNNVCLRKQFRNEMIDNRFI